MTIRFTCACGQPIAAREDYAGRRVQCVACKKVLTVPGEVRKTTLRPRTAPKTVLRKPAEGEAAQTVLHTPAPPAPKPRATQPTAHPSISPPPHRQVPPPEPPQAAAPPSSASAVPLASGPARPAGSTLLRPPSGAPATMLTRPGTGVRFRCACGADYQARPEHAGQPAVCPRCNDVLFIPSPAAVARAGGQPVLASRDRRGQYRPRPDGLSPPARLGVALAVLLLLGVGSYGAWAVYFKDVAEAGKQQASALGLVPDKATWFLCVRPNALRKIEAGQDLLRMVPANLGPLRAVLPADEADLLVALDKVLELRSGGVEALLCVDMGTHGRWWAAELTGDLRPQQKETLKGMIGVGPTKSTPNGKMYFISRSSPSKALYLVHDRLLVLAARESGMRAFFDSLDKSKDPDGRVQQAVARADPHTLLLAVATAPPELAGRAGGPPGQGQPAEQMLKELVKGDAGAVLLVEENGDKVRLSVDMGSSTSKGAAPLSTLHFELTLPTRQIQQYLQNPQRPPQQPQRPQRPPGGQRPPLRL